MASVGIKELLEAGVHFGHQTRRWNPKMRRYIHGEREGIYIIDLLKTERALTQAQEFVAGIARRGGTVLFVGTKKQARDAVKEVAESAGMPYVQHRWLGGLLTNWQTISLRIKRLHDLERYEAEGQLALLPTQERMAALADLAKLRANLGGVKNISRPPDAVLVVDLKTEAIAVREAQRLRIPLIGLVDTNCDPDGIDYVIPGNDDAMRSCSLILRAIGDVIKENRSVWQKAEEERMAREAEEAARRAAEEEARRAEEEARRLAEEQAALEAAERVEDRQGDAAATPKANQPVERGAPGAKPHPAPTVAEDLPARAGPRGKRGKQGATAADLSDAKGPGALPDSGAAAPAKAATPAAPASAKRTRAKKAAEKPAEEPTATPGEEAAAAAAEVLASDQAAETAAAPAETAAAPAETAAAPAETAEAPAETAEAPAKTAEAPAKTAAKTDEKENGDG